MSVYVFTSCMQTWRLCIVLAYLLHVVTLKGPYPRTVLEVSCLYKPSSGVTITLMAVCNYWMLVLVVNVVLMQRWQDISQHPAVGCWNTKVSEISQLSHSWLAVFHSCLPMSVRCVVLHLISTYLHTYMQLPHLI